MRDVFFLTCGRLGPLTNTVGVAVRDSGDVVLVDATTPEAWDHPTVPQVVGHFTRLSKMAAWGAQVGLQRPLAGALGDAIGLPGPAKAEKQEAFAHAGHNRWAAAEVDAWHASAAQARC